MKKTSVVYLAAAILAACSCSGLKRSDVKWVETVDFTVWKGEKTHAMALIEPGKDLSNVSLKINGDRNAAADFVFDVRSDVFTEKYDQCGPRKKTDFDSLLVADRIGPEKVADIAAGESRPVWVSINVPSGARAGKHSLTLKIKAAGLGSVRLPLEYTVADETLPALSDWKFDLDLWQNPFAVARYFDVPLWSDEHFEKMVPLYSRLAAAGQKAVTTSIIDRPWNGQTEDPFQSMIVKTRDGDGNWTYDYSIFDKWVEFMASLGIDRQIKCFTLIPWKLAYDYIDKESGETRYIEGSPGTEEFDSYWAPFIKDFAAHLRAKGWFEKTMLAMDERQHDALVACIGAIRKVEPEFQFSMACNRYYEDIQGEFRDLCVAFNLNFPDSTISARNGEGLLSSFYTCCAQKYPNFFLPSDPWEGAWIGWCVFKRNLTGYHRWAYNSWTKSPNEDGRFRRWPAGDCYMVYPEAASIRFENLVEGLQDHEKVSILKDRWTSEGRDDKLEALEKALERFTMEDLGENGPREALRAARAVISE